MRQAATAGDVSNTTWSRFEAGVGQLTPGIIQAVARAFDWPTDWPENPPEISQPVDLEARVARLELDLAVTRDSLAKAILAWRQERRGLLAALDSRSEQVSED